MAIAPAPGSIPPAGESPSAMPAGQARRRAVYGVNVAVSIAVALLLLLLVNWFAVWAFARVPAGARPWLRYDLTATRHHTLSPQTRRVLSELGGPLELIGVYPDGSVQAQAVTDLLEEYRRFDASVGVRTLHPRRDFVALRELYAEVESGMGDGSAMTGLRGGIGQGTGALRDVIETFNALLATFEEAAAGLDAGDAGEGNGLRVLDGLAGGLVKWIDEYEGKAALLEQLMGEPLPPLAMVKTDLEQTLRVTRAGRLGELERWLGRTGRDRLLSPGVRDVALRAQRELPGLRERLGEALSVLSAAAVDGEYARLREVVQQSAFVLVRSGGRVRVVSLRDMFVAEAGKGEEATAAETLPVRFLGEERLTGAVVSVGLASPPRLVLVSGDGSAALGQGGQFNYVAERVRASGFEVVVWPVVAEVGGSALNPPPTFEGRGGKTVWVVLPMDPSQQADASAKAQIAGVMRERFAVGDGVLLMPGLRVDAAYATADPVLVWAEEQGVAVDPGAVVLRPGTSSQGENIAERTFRQERWGDHVVTRSLAGRTVWFDLAHPVGEAAGHGGENVWRALVSLEAEGMWVEREPLGAGDLSRARADEGERVDSQVIAGAAEAMGGEGGGRLVVVADDLWATDTVIVRRRAGGNAELFANVAYWLAGLESAIDLTPRTQGLRRIGPISAGGRTAVRWLLLAGVPGLSLLAGVGVWMIRRRG